MPRSWQVHLAQHEPHGEPVAREVAVGTVEAVAHEPKGRADHALPHRLGAHVDEPGVEGKPDDLVGGGHRLRAEAQARNCVYAATRSAGVRGKRTVGMSDIVSAPPDAARGTPRRRTRPATGSGTPPRR